MIKERTLSDSPSLLPMTAQIVAAYLKANSVTAEGVPKLIKDVHGALAEVGAKPAADVQKPAVSIKRSVFSDYIICLEDGQKVTMRKRYIAVRFGLTPQAYRAKWGLSPDYPMVTPAYSQRRSKLAKDLGLGRKRSPKVEVQNIPAGKRGRRSAVDRGI